MTFGLIPGASNSKEESFLTTSKNQTLCKQEIFEGVNNYNDLVLAFKKVKAARVKEYPFHQGGILRKYAIRLGVFEIVIEFLDFGMYQQRLKFSLSQENKEPQHINSIDHLLSLLDGKSIFI